MGAALEEISDLEEVESQLLRAVDVLVESAERKDVNEFYKRNIEFEILRNKYCGLIGKDATLEYGTADDWDMARNKVATYLTYIENGYEPKPRLLQEARNLARRAA